MSNADTNSGPGLLGCFIRRVSIRNYKSIGKCDVELKPLTMLVGRNGAGKSNFLDALSFITDGLHTSLDHAIRDRGGIDAVRRLSTGHPRNFALGVEVLLRDYTHAFYGFELAAEKKGSFTVKDEKLHIFHGQNFVAGFHRSGLLLTECSVDNSPPVVRDRLYLQNLAGFPKFREIFEAFGSVGFYNLNPTPMRELQSPDAGDLLSKDGRNIASVVGRLHSDRPGVLERISTYLETIVPDISGVEMVTLGGFDALQFRQRVQGSEHPWKFYGASMSDGTLRALGGLVAVFQLFDREEPVYLVGIEEPEVALHPAAAGALMDALREATTNTQIVVTTHSPDLVSQIDTEEDGFLVVRAEEGVTKIARADHGSLSSIRDHLYDAGDLLRMDQLEPDPEDLDRQEQMELFERETAALA